jgi:hypothetical protein
MQLGKLFVVFVAGMAVSSCAYVDPSIYQPSPNKVAAKPTPTKSTIYIEQYDENAIEDYMSGLKGVVQFLSAAQSAQSTQIMHGQMLLGLALGQMKTSKIEIEVWPLPDRQKVWSLMGKRIQSYNDLVEEESARIIADPGFDGQVKNLVRSIKLIKKESLLSE